MFLFFDWKCSECGEVFEAVVRSPDDKPKKCKKCGSESATFDKQLSAPRWIEGTTPGSKPITTHNAHKHKVETIEDLYK